MFLFFFFWPTVIVYFRRVETNPNILKNIFFFFHRLLCHLTREAVDPIIERKRGKKEGEQQ